MYLYAMHLVFEQNYASICCESLLSVVIAAQQRIMSTLVCVCGRLFFTSACLPRTHFLHSVCLVYASVITRSVNAGRHQTIPAPALIPSTEHRLYTLLWYIYIYIANSFEEKYQRPYVSKRLIALILAGQFYRGCSVPWYHDYKVYCNTLTLADMHVSNTCKLLLHWVDLSDKLFFICIDVYAYAVYEVLY